MMNEAAAAFFVRLNRYSFFIINFQRKRKGTRMFKLIDTNKREREEKNTNSLQ